MAVSNIFLFPPRFLVEFDVHIFFSNQWLNHQLVKWCVNNDRFEPLQLPHRWYTRWEPCGLVQMEAMRLGTLPIVAPTGGLKDTVEAVFFFGRERLGRGRRNPLFDGIYARNNRGFPWLCYYLSVPWGTWICLSWVSVFWIFPLWWSIKFGEIRFFVRPC